MERYRVAQDKTKNGNRGQEDEKRRRRKRNQRTEMRFTLVASEINFHTGRPEGAGEI